jgi:uncharacterized protein YciU (UPF0263 family)
MEEKQYKSFLTNDPEYLKRTAEQIKEKPPIEEIKFDTLNKTLKCFGIEEDPYSMVSLANLKSGEVQKLVDDTYTKISSLGKFSLEQQEALDALWDYLSAPDSIEKADLIFVFGGQGEDRVNKAIELYKEGMATKILFTGKKAAYMNDVSESEAEYYAKKAIDNGVPEDALILEKEAINTVENAVKSVKMLKEMDFLPKSIILINHSFQMRRSYLTFKTNADWNTKLMKLPVAAEKFTKDTYYKDIEGWRFVFYEYIKLYGARLMKHF